MPPSKHALLGASNAHRWLECPPSARWEERFTEPPSSEAAEEGTLAHAIAEEHLRKLLTGKKPTTSAKHKNDMLYSPVMEEHVDTYTTYVLECFAEARAQTPDAMLMLEQRLDFSKWVPEGFGTGDAILIADGVMHVFDLKYGKGVPVSAVGNPQIRLYGLGALAEFDGLYDIREVCMHIVQPRLDDGISHESMSAGELYKWGDEYVKPHAELAYEGKGEHVAGEHCRWCRCRHVCRYFAEYNLKLAKLRFTEAQEERQPDELSPEEIAEVLESVDGLVRWAKSVKDWALEQAVNDGAEWPGWKLVEGRSNRVITDESDAVDLLLNAGYKRADVTRIQSLGTLEEVVGKKKLAELLGDLIVKPAGKPVLAKESDKRPAINSTAAAQAVFSPVEGD